MKNEEIFQAYLDEVCPLCLYPKKDDDFHCETTSGGKTMSLEFYCRECHSRWVVGFERSRNPISSSIIDDNFNKSNL